MNQEKLAQITTILSKKTVGIAGVGGLGSNVAVALARSKIGRLIIVDHDIVDESNLNRQYFFQDDIGKVKVEALSDIIHRVNPSVSITAVHTRLMPGCMHEPFHGADVIIEALDEALSKKQFIEDVLEHLPGVPLIGASGVAGYGQSDRIVTRELGNLYLCYDEHAPSSDDDVLLAPKVALMANWQADLALTLLIGDIR